MAIVTLTTDFGTRDFFSGALKGALLREVEGLQVIDISHEIMPYNIVQGAFTLGQAWREFPAGAVHILAVNCVYAPGFRFLAMERDGHYFLAPDNGILSLLFADFQAEGTRKLDVPEGAGFPVKAVLPPAVAALLRGRGLDGVGEPAGEVTGRISLQPVVKPDQIRGAVVHIDYFDNAVVNIDRVLFEKVGQGRPFSLFFKRHDPLQQISMHYCDVSVGEPLCLFNSAGLLEIAINMGKAATLLGLKPEDIVEISFHEAEAL